MVPPTDPDWPGVPPPAKDPDWPGVQGGSDYAPALPEAPVAPGEPAAPGADYDAFRADSVGRNAVQAAADVSAPAAGPLDTVWTSLKASTMAAGAGTLAGAERLGEVAGKSVRWLTKVGENAVTGKRLFDVPAPTPEEDADLSHPITRPFGRDIGFEAAKARTIENRPDLTSGVAGAEQVGRTAADLYAMTTLAKVTGAGFPGVQAAKGLLAPVYRGAAGAAGFAAGEVAVGHIAGHESMADAVWNGVATFATMGAAGVIGDELVARAARPILGRWLARLGSTPEGLKMADRFVSVMSSVPRAVGLSATRHLQDGAFQPSALDRALEGDVSDVVANVATFAVLHALTPNVPEEYQRLYAAKEYQRIPEQYRRQMAVVTSGLQDELRASAPELNRTAEEVAAARARRAARDGVVPPAAPADAPVAPPTAAGAAPKAPPSDTPLLDAAAAAIETTGKYPEAGQAALEPARAEPPPAQAEVRPTSVLDAAERAGIPGAKEARENLDSLPESDLRYDDVNKRWTREPVAEATFEPPAEPKAPVEPAGPRADPSNGKFRGIDSRGRGVTDGHDRLRYFDTEAEAIEAARAQDAAYERLRGMSSATPPATAEPARPAESKADPKGSRTGLTLDEIYTQLERLDDPEPPPPEYLKRRDDLERDYDELDAARTEIAVRERRKKELAYWEARARNATTPKDRAEAAKKAERTRAEMGAAGDVFAEPPASAPPETKPAPAAEKAGPRLEPVSEGRSLEIPVPDGKPVPAKYAVVERSSLRPSHRPSEGFARTPGYPTANKLQERPYDTDKSEQAKVLDVARKMNPAEVVNTSPRATEGPPTVAFDGTVINGNGRSMAMELMSPEQKAKYREHLVEQATAFGLDPAKIAAAKDPVLVRVVEMDPTTSEAADFGRQGNMGAMQAVGPIARAKRTAHLIPDSLLENLANDPEATFSELVVQSQGADFRRALRDAIPTTERPEFFTSTGDLTEQGKELARNIILTKAIGPDAVDGLSPQLRRTLSDSAAQLGQLRQDAHNAPILDAFTKALDVYRNTLQNGAVAPQEGIDTALFDKPDLSPAERLFLDFVYDNAGAPKRLRKGLSDLLANRAQETGMFGSEPIEDTIRRALVDQQPKGPKADQPVVVKKTDGTTVDGVFVRPTAKRIVVDTPEGRQRIPKSDVENVEPMGRPLTEDEKAFGAPRRTDLARTDEGTPKFPAVSDDPLMGSRQKGTGEATMTEAPALPGEPVGVHQVRQALEALHGKRLYIGRLRSWKNAGEYYATPDYARVRNANDVSTMAHEVGHALDKDVLPWAQQDPSWPSMRDELVALGKDIYPNPKSPPAAGYAREGFAEWHARYFASADMARAEHPEFTRWMEDVFLKANPELAKSYGKVSSVFGRYVGQGSTNRLRGDIRRETGRSRWREWWAAATTKRALVDSNDPINKATEHFEAEQAKRGADLVANGASAKDLAELRQGTAPAVANRWLNAHQTDIHGSVVGPSLKEIWSKKGIVDAADDAAAYLVARQQLAELKKGRATTHGRRDLEAAVEELRTPERDQLVSDMIAFNRNTLAYAEAARAITPEAAAKMREAGDYIVPMNRIFDPLDLSRHGESDASTPGNLRRKAAGGSVRQIRDPRESIIASMEGVIAAAHHAQVREAVLAMAGKADMGDFVRHVPKDKLKRAVTVERIRDGLADLNVDTRGVDGDATLEWWDVKQFPDSKDLIIRSTDGEWYEVRRDLHESLKNISPDRVSHPLLHNVLWKVPGQIGRLANTSYRAGFALRNTLKDFFTAYVQGGEGNIAKYAAAWGKTFGQVFRAELPDVFGGREAEPVRLFRDMGGEFSASLGMDRAPNLREARNLGTTLGGRIRSNPVRQLLRAPGTALDLFRELVNMTESVPRVAELERSLRESGWKPGDALTLSMVAKPMLDAKNVTVNFGKAGDFVRSMNQGIPFLAAGVQGPLRFAKQMREHPIATITRGLSTVTALSLVNWLRYKDEAWWKDATPQQRWNRVLIPFGKELLGIPLTNEMQVFQLPVAMLDAAYRKDPKAAMSAAAAFLKGLNPVDIPPLAKEALAQALNMDVHFKTPIESRAVQNLHAEERVGPRTTGLAEEASIGLSHLGVKVSPLRIDHAIRGLGGGATADFVGWLTGRESEGRMAEPADVPVVGGLFTPGGKEGMNSAAVEEVYQKATDARERSASLLREPETPAEALERSRLDDSTAVLSLLAKARRGTTDPDVRQKINARSREIAMAVLEGSKPPPEAVIYKELRALGLDPNRLTPADKRKARSGGTPGLDFLRRIEKDGR